MQRKLMNVIQATVTNIHTSFNFSFPYKKSENMSVNPPHRRILKHLYVIYRWLIAIPLFVCTTIFFTPICLFLVFFVSPKAGSRFAAVPWARISSWLTPVFPKVSGKENIAPHQSYVIIANHQSHFDIFVIYGWLGVDFKWVMKESLKKAPFIGIACEKMEHVFIDRSNTEAALRSINEAKSKITNGTSIFFFPEGTRSATGEIKPFKKGAFKMALDLNLPILPITIKGTHRVLPKNTLNLFPGKVEMTIHPPITTSHYAEKTAKDIMHDAEQIIKTGL